MNTETPAPSHHRPLINRRRLVIGAAWAAPAAIVTTPALAVQASQNQCGDQDLPAIGFGAMPNGETGTTRTWETTEWSAEDNLNNWAGSQGDLKDPGFRMDILESEIDGPWFGVGLEPQEAGSIEATKNDPIYLTPGCQYQVAGYYATWEGDPHPVELTLELRGPDGITVPLVELETEVNLPNPGRGLDGNARAESAPFDVPVSGPWTVAIVINFPEAVRGNNSANDIYLGNLSLVHLG